jgi:hypothetical protein
MSPFIYEENDLAIKLTMLEEFSVLGFSQANISQKYVLVSHLWHEKTIVWFLNLLVYFIIHYQQLLRSIKNIVNEANNYYTFQYY